MGKGALGRRRNPKGTALLRRERGGRHSKRKPYKGRRLGTDSKRIELIKRKLLKPGRVAGKNGGTPKGVLVHCETSCWEILKGGEMWSVQKRREKGTLHI